MISYTSNTRAKFNELSVLLEHDSGQRSELLESAIRIYEALGDNRQVQRLSNLRDTPYFKDGNWPLPAGIRLRLKFGRSALGIDLEFADGVDKRSTQSVLAHGQLGMLEELTGTTLVPHKFTRYFSKDWRGASHSLAKLFGQASEQLDDLHNAARTAQSIRIESEDTVLQALPLELTCLQPTGPPLNYRLPEGVIYRAGRREHSERARVRWLQAALSVATGQTSLWTDGVLGPQTHIALIEFQAQRGLNPSGTVTVETLDALGKSLKNQEPRPPRVLVVSASTAADLKHLRGHARFGMRWDHIYREHGYDTENCDSLDVKYIGQLIRKTRPELIHITSPLQEDPSTSDVYLDLSGADSLSGERLTAARLRKVLSTAYQRQQEPVVILDVPWPPHELEGVRQLFLRNAYGMELFRGSKLGNVLCAGFTHSGEPLPGAEEQCQGFAEHLKRAASWQALFQNWKGRLQPEMPDQLNWILPTATALFTHDPSLPLMLPSDR